MALVVRARKHIFPIDFANLWLCCRCLLHIFPRQGAARGLHGWLVGWLIGWPVGWLAGRLAGWLRGCLAAWLVGWLARWLVGWLAGWLTKVGAGGQEGGRGKKATGRAQGRKGRKERREKEKPYIKKSGVQTPDRPKAVMLSKKKSGSSFLFRHF